MDAALKSELMFLKKTLLDTDRPRTSKEADLQCPRWIYTPYSGAKWLSERLEFTTTKSAALANYCAWRRWAYLLNSFYTKLLGEKILRLATFPYSFHGSTLEDLCKHLVHSKSSSSRKDGDEIILVYPDQESKLDEGATISAYVDWAKAGRKYHFSDSYQHAVILVDCELQPIPEIEYDLDDAGIDPLTPIRGRY